MLPKYLSVYVKLMFKLGLSVVFDRDYHLP